MQDWFDVQSASYGCYYISVEINGYDTYRISLSYYHEESNMVDYPTDKTTTSNKAYAKKTYKKFKEYAEDDRYGWNYNNAPTWEYTKNTVLPSVSKYYFPESLSNSDIKLYLSEDINDYSYTGPDFADDRIWIATYTGDDGYTDLVVDSNICYVSTLVISDTTDEEYTEFPISEIDKAIELYNRDLERLGETGNLTRQEAEDVLADHGYYIDDYLPDGFYDRLKNSKTREETNKVFDDYREIMKDRGEL